MLNGVVQALGLVHIATLGLVTQLAGNLMDMKSIVPIGIRQKTLARRGPPYAIFTPLDLFLGIPIFRLNSSLEEVGPLHFMLNGICMNILRLGSKAGRMGCEFTRK